MPINPVWLPQGDTIKGPLPLGQSFNSLCRGFVGLDYLTKVIDVPYRIWPVSTQSKSFPIHIAPHGGKLVATLLYVRPHILSKKNKEKMEHFCQNALSIYMEGQCYRLLCIIFEGDEIE